MGNTAASAAEGGGHIPSDAAAVDAAAGGSSARDAHAAAAVLGGKIDTTRGTTQHRLRDVSADDLNALQRLVMDDVSVSWALGVAGHSDAGGDLAPCFGDGRDRIAAQRRVDDAARMLCAGVHPGDSLKARLSVMSRHMEGLLLSQSTAPPHFATMENRIEFCRALLHAEELSLARSRQPYAPCPAQAPYTSNQTKEVCLGLLNDMVLAADAFAAESQSAPPGSERAAAQPDIARTTAVLAQVRAMLSAFPPLSLVDDVTVRSRPPEKEVRLDASNVTASPEAGNGDANGPLVGKMWTTDSAHVEWTCGVVREARSSYVSCAMVDWVAWMIPSVVDLYISVDGGSTFLATTTQERSREQHSAAGTMLSVDRDSPADVAMKRSGARATHIRLSWSGLMRGEEVRAHSGPRYGLQRVRAFTPISGSVHVHASTVASNLQHWLASAASLGGESCFDDAVEAMVSLCLATGSLQALLVLSRMLVDAPPAAVLSSQAGQACRTLIVAMDALSAQCARRQKFLAWLQRKPLLHTMLSKFGRLQIADLPNSMVDARGMERHGTDVYLYVREHAHAKVRYTLSGWFDHFSAAAELHPDASDGATLAFEVLGDGHVLHRVDRVASGDSIKIGPLSVKGVRELDLLVVSESDDAPPGVWKDPAVETSFMQASLEGPGDVEAAIASSTSSSQSGELLSGLVSQVTESTDSLDHRPLKAMVDRIGPLPLSDGRVAAESILRACYQLHADALKDDKFRGLCHAFALDVSAGTVRSLTQLLATLVPRANAGDHASQSMARTALSLLESHLLCLRKLRIDPAEVGFSADNSESHRGFTLELKQILLGIIRHPTEAFSKELAPLAGRVLTHSIDLMFREGPERVQLLLEFLRPHAGEVEEFEDVTYAVLAELLVSFAQPQNIQMLLPGSKAFCDTEGRDAVQLLIRVAELQATTGCATLQETRLRIAAEDAALAAAPLRAEEPAADRAPTESSGAPANAAADSAAASFGPQEWNCETCTLRNEAGTNICMACGSMRPAPSPADSGPPPAEARDSAHSGSGGGTVTAAGGAGAAAGHAGREWICTTCTTVNNMSQQACVVCRARQPGAVSADLHGDGLSTSAPSDVAQSAIRIATSVDSNSRELRRRRFSCAVSNVLLAYERQVYSGFAKSDENRQAALDFTDAILRSASAILDTVQSTITDPACSRIDDACATLLHILEFSVVGTVLPSVVPMLALSIESCDVATRVLPGLIRTIGLLDGVCRQLADVPQAHALLRAVSNRDIARDRSGTFAPVSSKLPTAEDPRGGAGAGAGYKNVLTAARHGEKDSYDGQVGFSFVARRSLRVYALGRSVNPACHNGRLHRAHPVRLWDVTTKELLAETTVDDFCERDALGFAVSYLPSALTLEKGHEFAITSHEFAGCGDGWYDGFARDGGLAVDAADIVPTGDCFREGLTVEFPGERIGETRGFGVPTLFVQPQCFGGRRRLIKPLQTSGSLHGMRLSEPLPNDARGDDVDEADTRATFLPWLLDLEKSASFVAGKAATTLVRATSTGPAEMELQPWLQLPVFRGGFIGDEASGLQTERWDSVFTATSVSEHPREPTDTRGPVRDSEADTASRFLLQVASNVEDESSTGRVLISYFEAHHPEKLLERRQAVYADCELPILAALLHHTGAVGDARYAVEYLRSPDARPTEHPMSPLLHTVWSVLKGIRRWLRQQKRAFDRKLAMRSSGAADDSSSSDSDSDMENEDRAILRGGGAAESKDAVHEREEKEAHADQSSTTRTGSGLVKPANSRDKEEERRQRAMRRRYKSLKPRDFESQRAQVSARALLLLKFVPGAEFIRAKRAPLPLVESDESTSLSSAAVDSTQSVCQACLTYVRHGVAAPAEDVAGIVEVRGKRAARRQFGLEALASLLQSVSCVSARVDAVMFLRDAMGELLRAEAPRQPIDARRDWQATTVQRYHPLQGLDAAPVSGRTAVMAAFQAVYSELAQLLDVVTSDEYLDPSLAHTVLCCWALDFEAADESFLSSQRMVDRIARASGMPWMLERDTRSRGVSASAGDAASSTLSPWRVWSPQFVRAALRRGVISKAQVIEHMWTLPSESSDRLPADWYTGARQTLAPDGRSAVEVANGLEIATVAAEYRSFALQVGFQPVEGSTLDSSTFFSSSVSRMASRLLAFFVCGMQGGFAARLDDEVWRSITASNSARSAAIDRNGDGAADAAPTEQASVPLRSVWRYGSTVGLNLSTSVAGQITEYCMTQLPALAAALETAASHPEVEVVQVDRALLDLLLLITDSVAISGGDDNLSLEGQYTPLLVGMIRGSPTTQRVAGRLLRSLVDRLSATAVDAEVCRLIGVAPDATMCCSVFVDFLLRRIVDGMCPSRDSGVLATSCVDAICAPSGYGGGVARLSAACEAVGMLRTMMAKPGHWKDAVTESLVTVLMVCEGSLDWEAAEEEQTAEAIAHLAFGSAALCVLGAATQTLRPGGRVLVESGGAAASTLRVYGTVVSCELDSPLATVTFGDGTAVATDVASLTAVDDVPVTPDTIPMACVAPFLDVISGLLALKIPRPVAAAEAETKEEEDAATAAAAALQRTDEQDLPVPELPVWSALHVQLKHRGVQVLATLCQHQSIAQEAWEAGVLPSVVDAALAPVTLPSFVALTSLQRRESVLQCRLNELDHESYCNMLSPPDPDAADAVPVETGGAADAGMGAAAETAAAAAAVAAEEALTPEERSRRDAAQMLASMGLGFDVSSCEVALKNNGDDVNRAAEWLMTNPDAAATIAAEKAARGSAAGPLGGKGKSKTTKVAPSAARRSVEKDEVRWAKAQELSNIYGMPVKLCFHSLMMHGEEPNAAMSWLMDVGSRYVEQFMDAATSKAAAADDAEADALTKAAEKLSDTAALEDAGHVQPLMDDAGAPSRRRRRAAAGGAGAFGIDEAQAQASEEGDTQADEDAAAALRAARGAPEVLLEPITAPPPIAEGVEPRPVGTGLRPGCLLTLSGDDGALDRLEGVTGTLEPQGVAISAAAVGASPDEQRAAAVAVIRFVDPESGVAQLHQISLDVAHLHSRLYGRKVYTAGMARSLFGSTAAALCSHYARRAVVQLLGHVCASTDIDASVVGGPDKVVSLVKLAAAAEAAFSQQNSRGFDDADEGGGDLMTQLRAVVRRLLSREAALVSGLGAATLSRKGVLSDQFVQECVSNFVFSTASGASTERRTMDSLHPFFHQCDYRGEVFFENAKALRVVFDPRCDICTSGTSLVFFSDRECSTKIASFQGTRFSPFVVHSDRLFYRFTSSKDPGEHGWGYRFHVSPMRGLQWLREEQVLRDPSLEWACWLLQFMLNDVEALVASGAVHNVRVYDALVSYLRRPGAPFKHRVVSLLTQLLVRPHLFPVSELPDLSSVAGISSAVLERCQAEKDKGELFLPRGLLQLVELAITAARAQRVLLRISSRTTSSDNMASGSPRLHDGPAPSTEDETVTRGDGDGSATADHGAASGSAPAAGGAGGGAAKSTADADGSVSKGSRPEGRAPVLMAPNFGGASGNNDIVVDADGSGPLDPPLELSLTPPIEKMGMLDQLVMVADAAECLYKRTRLPDMFMCEAWLDAEAFTKVVESAHPFKVEEPISGTICIPGATALDVRIDDRSAVGAYASLSLTGGGSGAWEMPREIPKDWRGIVLRFKGDKVAYEFQPGAENADGHWGFAFSVTALTVRGEKKRKFVALAGGLEAVESAVRTNAQWTAEADEKLVEWVNEYASAAGLNSTEVAPHLVQLSRKDFQFKYQQLGFTSLKSLQLRFAVLRAFNSRLRRCIELLDFSSTDVSHSVAYMLRALRHLIFSDVKSVMLEAAIEMTWHGRADSGVRVTLDNMKAMHSREVGDVEPSTSMCIFAQSFRQLSKESSTLYRSKLDRKERLFHVSFAGEEGMDWGGLFRDAVNRMVEDLFSPHFGLLVLCPNGRASVGLNNEKYLPDSRRKSPLVIEMFEFVGRLMGMSMRHKMCLPFDFPSLVWRQLVGQTPDTSDLAAVDVALARLLASLRDCEENGIDSEEAFAEEFPDMFFTSTRMDGSDVEVMPGGRAIRVTLANRRAYCDRVEAMRLKEASAHVAAMLRGITSVVPGRALQLMTWQELEVAVSGRPEIDIALLRRHTEYDGYSKDDPVIQRLWRVLESFTNEERTLFVRFVWGRSRLPVQRRWPRKMKIQRRSAGQNELPHSHTCFFSIELPPYATDAVMRKRLLAAVHFGLGGILNA